MALFESYTPPDQSRELIIIDPRITDYQTLLEDLSDSADVKILDANQDGVTQISTILAEQHNLSALHILSHGQSGSVTLGCGALSLVESQHPGRHHSTLGRCSVRRCGHPVLWL
ncbi:MAG: DUF4347 domain-containing protein [Magnetococcales bacterium]|nr:DUF4347 domain-containing protein [Magnetococcales bacterium]